MLMKVRKFIVDNGIFLFLLVTGLALAILLIRLSAIHIMPATLGSSYLMRIQLQPVEGILTLLYFIIVGFILWCKFRESNVCIGKAYLKDHAWDERRMVAFVRELYPQYVESLVNQDISIVSPYLTASFNRKHSSLIRKMIEKKQEYRSEIFKINKVEIIEVHDFKDNECDNFTAYIKVEKKKYYVIDGELYGKTETSTHEELFNFIRSRRGWLLDSVNVKPTPGDFSCLESFSE